MVAERRLRWPRSGQAPGISLAVLAAVLFGASTPGAHWLLERVPPVLLSALLYLGSGIGLGILWLAGRILSARPRTGKNSTDALQALPLRLSASAHNIRSALAMREQQRALWHLGGAIACGGVLAPIALMLGLQSTAASSAALLLNLEGVMTAVLAWCVFGESVDAGVASGMLCVVAGGLLLAWPDQAGAVAVQPDQLRGPLLIALACLAWAVDNNLTRGAANLDARAIACWKGLVAGSVNLLLASVVAGGVQPLLDQLQTVRGSIPLALLTGCIGYGISLVAYVRAQALLGAARTGAWFGLAPFAGVSIALLVLREPAPALLWPAAALIALGLWLHVRERHAHWHQHEALEHQHAHMHDAHHQHAHDFAWDGTQPHTHVHTHAPLLHRHVHFPDLHHRHGHATQRHAVADSPNEAG